MQILEQFRTSTFRSPTVNSESCMQPSTDYGPYERCPALNTEQVSFMRMTLMFILVNTEWWLPKGGVGNISGVNKKFEMN